MGMIPTPVRLTDSVDRGMIPDTHPLSKQITARTELFFSKGQHLLFSQTQIVPLRVVNHLRRTERRVLEFLKCQHDWLSLLFCTMSPNHRVAVAKKAPNYELPVVATCQKEKALNSQVAPRLPSANPNNVFNGWKKMLNPRIFVISFLDFFAAKAGAGRVWWMAW